MKRIAVAWPGFTGYMDGCWRELSKTCEVRLFLEQGAMEHRFDGSELAGLNWRRVKRGEFEQAIAEIRSFKPDAVCACGWSTPFSRAVARTDFGCRKIIFFSMLWERTVRKFVAKWVLWPILRHFDAAYVPSSSAQKYACWLGFAGRVGTGANPSGWERFNEAGHASDGFVFAGRLAPEKNLGLLLRAYALYRGRVDNPWRLDIIGEGHIDGELPEGVSRLGFVRPQDMPAAISRSASFVMPSKHETWGVSAMEAMSAGLLVIASDACGFVYDVPPAVSFASGDLEALANALVRVHNMSPAERNATIAAGRRHAQRYATPEWVRRLKEIAFPVPRVIDFWEGRCTESDGKLELVWSGRLGTQEAAARMLIWNIRREGVAKLLQRLFGWLPGKGPYGIFVNRRRKKAAQLARVPGSPEEWVFEASCPEPVSLAFEVRDAGGKSLLERTFEFGPVPERVVIPLPPVAAAARFSVRPANGKPGRPIRILENTLRSGSTLP